MTDLNVNWSILSSIAPTYTAKVFCKHVFECIVLYGMKFQKCCITMVASGPGISGNLEKSGNFVALEKKIREKSGNFVKFKKVRKF